jgi:hypothetical protein
MAARSPEASERLARIGLALVLAVAAALRWWACRNELWFDEIWSLLQVRGLDSPLGVLNAIHHDNNHYLNSWYLLAVDGKRPFFVFRLHSLAAGIGAVVLGVASARGRSERLLTALLLGGSYLLIQYASEARGYALLIFFAFASFLVTRRWLASRSTADTVLYWLCAILGLLSHLSYLHVLVALIAWTTAVRLREAPTRRQAAGELLGLQGVPLLFVATLYIVDLRHLIRGGGPDYVLSEVLVATLSYLVGGPASGALAWLAALAAAVACAAAIALLRREGRSEWVFFLVVVAVSPALLLVATRPEVLFVRYFLVSVAFGLLLIAGLLARVARLGRAGAAVAALVAAAITIGNGIHTAELLQHGRGAFHAALLAIAERDDSETITFGGTHPRYDAMMLAFYRDYLGPGNRLRYLPPEAWGSEPPAWILASRRDRRLPPREETIVAGARYRLVASYESAPLSGKDWFVYRRQPAAE